MTLVFAQSNFKSGIGLGHVDRLQLVPDLLLAQSAAA